MERIKRVLFFKIHDIWFDEEKFKNSKYNIVILHTNADIGSKYQFKFVGHTFLLNIEEDEEIIFKKLDYKSARYAINRAKRDGVIVKKIESDQERKEYVEFQKTFCAEKEIPMFHEDELNELISYYAISKDGEYLGACSFIADPYKETVRYKYGATKHKLSANEIILWTAICDFHNEGYKLFDFGGVIEGGKSSDEYKGYYQFKKKFGGDFVESYSYIKTNGVYKFWGLLGKSCINVVWKGNTNEFVRWLARKKLLQ